MESLIFIPYYFDIDKSNNFHNLSGVDRTDYAELNYFMYNIFKLKPTKHLLDKINECYPSLGYSFRNYINGVDIETYNSNKIFNKVKLNDITTVDCVRILLTDRYTGLLKNKEQINTNDSLNNLSLVKITPDIKNTYYIIRVNEAIAEYLYFSNDKERRYELFKKILNKIKEIDTSNKVINSGLFMTLITLFCDKIKYDIKI